MVLQPSTAQRCLRAGYSVVTIDAVACVLRTAFFDPGTVEKVPI